MDLVADTVFYIDIQRKRPAPAAWISANPGARLILTPVVYAELLVGQPDEAVVRKLTGNGLHMDIDFDVAREWGRIKRSLQRQGTMIGPNDLWIAAVALVNGLPVLTRNVGEFSRVPGLRVEAY